MKRTSLSNDDSVMVKSTRQKLDDGIATSLLLTMLSDDALTCILRKMTALALFKMRSICKKLCALAITINLPPCVHALEAIWAANENRSEGKKVLINVVYYKSLYGFYIDYVFGCYSRNVFSRQKAKAKGACIETMLVTGDTRVDILCKDCIIKDTAIEIDNTDSQDMTLPVWISGELTYSSTGEHQKVLWRYITKMIERAARLNNVPMFRWGMDLWAMNKEKIELKIPIMNEIRNHAFVSNRMEKGHRGVEEILASGCYHVTEPLSGSCQVAAARWSTSDDEWCHGIGVNPKLAQYWLGITNGREFFYTMDNIKQNVLMAAKGGNLIMLKVLHRYVNLPTLARNSDEFVLEMVLSLLKRNTEARSREVLEWIADLDVNMFLNCTTFHEQQLSIRYKICWALASRGFLNLLEWFEFTSLIILQKYEGDPVVINKLAGYDVASQISEGSSSLMKTKRARRRNSSKRKSSYCTLLVEVGNIQALKKAHALGWSCGKDTYKAAVEGEYTDIMLWLAEQNCPIPWSACLVAGELRDIAMLNLVWEHGSRLGWIQEKKQQCNDMVKKRPPWRILKFTDTVTVGLVADRPRAMTLINWTYIGDLSQKELPIVQLGSGLGTAKDVEVCEWFADKGMQVKFSQWVNVTDS